MKVATNRPDLVKRPVYVSATEYEIWYSKPAHLGNIYNRGGYWYTKDGMRFVSSRDAMEYLIRLFHLGSGETNAPELLAPVANSLPASVAISPVRKGKAGASARRLKKEIPAESYNQNHPLFQQFLELLNKVQSMEK